MRKNTKNIHKSRINAVLVYIQENIHKPLTLGKLAEVSHISPFHFHRIFKAEVGESINSHIKRIRLEQAAFQIKYGHKSIADIASSCGYQTAESFSKAFKQYFNISPSQYKHGELTRIVPNSGEQSQQLKSLAGVAPIAKRTIPKQLVLFVRKKGEYQKAASEAWSTLLNYAYRNQLMTSSIKQIGITYDSPTITSDNHIRYEACLKIEKKFKPDGDFGVQYIHGGQYAIFHHRGPYESMTTTYEAIYSRWLPESKEKLHNSPSFSLYVNSLDNAKEDELLTEIYIPLE